GSYGSSPAPSNIISAWAFTIAPAVPQTGDENVRINLWLLNGIPPTDNHEVEFVIKSFEFVPLGPPPPATLTNFNKLQDGLVHFLIGKSQPDRRYQVQASTNLFDWQNLATILATNTFIDFLDSSSAGCSRRFFRTLTMP